MRRWLVILLLLIYPFQVALAMADRCCLTTPQGVTHHATSAEGASIQPMLVAADDHGGASDPHCAACVFVHTLSMPPALTVIPAIHAAEPVRTDVPATLISHPAARPERPKWPPAAD